MSNSWGRGRLGVCSLLHQSGEFMFRRLSGQPTSALLWLTPAVARKIFSEVFEEIHELVRELQDQLGLPEVELQFNASRGFHLSVPAAAFETDLDPRQCCFGISTVGIVWELRTIIYQFPFIDP